MTYCNSEQVQQPHFADVEGLKGETVSALVAKQSPPQSDNQVFRFSQKFIPAEGNAPVLRLTEFPKLIVDKRTMEFEVEGWGIRMPCSEVYDLPRRMGRRFIELFSKADRQEDFTEEEEMTWFNVVNQVDYDRFSYDRAAPQYVEGTLIRRSPHFVVEWYDGERENLSPTVARSLALIETGESFGAFVKFGSDNQTIAIERVTIRERVLQA
jgi:hypothetical protein